MSVPDGAGSRLTAELLAPLADYKQVLVATDADEASRVLSQESRHVGFALSAVSEQQRLDAILAELRALKSASAAPEPPPAPDGAVRELRGTATPAAPSSKPASKPSSKPVSRFR